MKEGMKENNGGCNFSDTTNKEWRKKPRMRINKSKGHAYVQVRNVFGNWVTMGELTSESFAMAWALVNSIEGEFLQDRIHKSLERHHLGHLKDEFDSMLNDARTSMEYKVSETSPWNPDQDGSNTETTLFGQALNKDAEAMRKMASKEAMKSKKANRKLRHALKIPEEKKEERGKKE